MILALVTVIVAATALAVRLYQQYGDPAYRAEVVSYTDITDTGLVITFRVHLPRGEGAVCAVRARDRSGIVVGRGEVAVPAGSPQFSHSLPTTSRPFIGEVVRCRPAS